MNFPHKDFEKASCKDANIEKAMLVDMFDKIDSDKLNIHAMILVKDASKVFDAYAAGYGPEFKENVYSIAKSFTSVAIGILQDRGLLKVEDLLLPYFKNELTTWNPVFEKLTIKHLLTMCVGHAYDLSYESKDVKDPIQFFFSSEVVDQPGTKFMYNNFASFMLSALVTKLTKKSLADFLYENLFQILEIDKPVWQKIGKYTNGASGLELSAVDLAKFGLLLLNNGKWKETQIVSSDYLQVATSFQVPTSHVENPKDQFGYGYQFWMNDFGDYRCAGWLKQYIVINKEFNVVFVTQAFEERELLNLFTSYIIPGFRNGWVYDSYTLRNYIQRFHENSLEIIKNEKLTRKF